MGDGHGKLFWVVDDLQAAPVYCPDDGIAGVLQGEWDKASSLSLLDGGAGGREENLHLESLEVLGR